MKKFLHIGCGPQTKKTVHPLFQSDDWEEIRVDADSSVNPDIRADMTTLAGVDENGYQGIYCSHALEHLHSQNAYIALTNFHRVLRPNGLAIITVPDIKVPAKMIAEGKIDVPVYHVPNGNGGAYAIMPLDMLYGFHLYTLDNPFMMHRTGFTKETLELYLLNAGFSHVNVTENVAAYELVAFARK